MLLGCFSLIYLIIWPPERPDRPRDLELSDLAERSVKLTWIPGDDNNSPITGQCRPHSHGSFGLLLWGVGKPPHGGL